MSKKCFLCKSSEDNELLFGKFYSKWKLTVHYYCLLLSSNLVQRGSNDTVGIFGFLESDIRKENERTKKCRCYICKDMHANVSCCSKKCLRTFHTACGIMNGCLSHYTDTYQSWCSAHVPLEPDSSPHTNVEPCSICYDEMGQYDVITSIKAPCCRNGWFHQGCVAQYAQSAGYFFKCPLCKNEDKFLAEIPLRGVFVPERDAAWELEPNAFQEQLQRPTDCDANECKCQEGRSVNNRQWRLIACGSCGSTCRHWQCMDQMVDSPRVYLCQFCRPIIGDRVKVLENIDDSDDSSDDDAVSKSTSTSLDITLSDRARRNLSSAGYEESGAYNSSSDETLGNIRRAVNSRRAVLNDSDDERSDGSSVEIRRCIRQNTGKRVRRLLSDESEDEKSPIPSPSDDLLRPDACKRLEGGNLEATCALDYPSPAVETGENSCSSSRSMTARRKTRQLTRRLSSLSDSSKRSTSDSNKDERELKSSSSRRPIIYSSSDDSEKQSEGETHNSHKTDDFSAGKERYATRQQDNHPPPSAKNRKHRPSSSSDDFENRSKNKTNKLHVLDGPLICAEHQTTSSRTNKACLPSTKRKDASTLASRTTETMEDTKSAQGTNSSGNQEISKRWDENSNMTSTVLAGEGRSSSVSEKSENANASDTSLENVTVATRRTRQLTKRLSLGEAGKRSTSESSMDIIRSKRTRAARISTLPKDSDKRTKDSENGSTDNQDFAPQNKRRRIREQRNKANPSATTTKRHQTPSISPPSTPSSLASDSSQPSVASNGNGNKSRTIENGKQTGSGTLNLQQQSMIQFLTFANRNSATTSSSSDRSTEEIVSPSRWSQFGSSNKINSKISPISNKRAATTTKRRRTRSPKKSNKVCSNDKQQTGSSPTSSNAASAQQGIQKGHTVHKDKGQKNILNYFNRY
ncbi:nucleolar protein dao-5-like [Anopheles moucheti]|uniref:nucleolar protein dao-5-like n=1 Tax=Anopheles moucheti TaxID=186751 RepID=UPI0022F08649|nr:nucleolar protein dao-5-like [Anopheles moucheti]